MRVLSYERASADTADGASVGATVLRIVLPDPEVAALIAATTEGATTPSAADSRAIARPLGLALQAAVADGSLVLP
jgi:hypothetical protein